MRSRAAARPRSLLHTLLIVAFVSGAMSCTHTIGSGTVRCHYMSYACGDCAPQFKVDSVLAGPLDQLRDQDIHVVLDGSTTFVDSLDRLICWTFIAEGSIRLEDGAYALNAMRLERHLRPDCCSK